MNQANNLAQVDPLAVLRTVSTELEMSARYGGQLSREALFHLSRNVVAAEAAVAKLVEAVREFDAAMRSEADTDGMLRREAARVRRAAALRPFTGERA